MAVPVGCSYRISPLLVRDPPDLLRGPHAISFSLTSTAGSTSRHLKGSPRQSSATLEASGLTKRSGVPSLRHFLACFTNHSGGLSRYSQSRAAWPTPLGRA